VTLHANATVANNGCINPGNAHGAPDGVWTGNDDNSEDWDCRWGFENPSNDLADTQDIRALVRKNATGGNGDPTVTVELWENGSQISTLQGSTAISSTTGVEVGGTFDASVLSDNSGAGIEVRLVVVGTGGMPTGRRSVQVDAFTFTPEFDALPALAPTLLTPADESVVTDPTFTWQFNTDNSDQEAVQEAFAFRRTYDAVDAWWDGSAWVGTETWVESATESVTIPVEDFPANEAVQWTVATRESIGLDGPYATPWGVTISVLEAPTLVAPADGADHDGQDFSWQFNAQALGGTQTEYAFMRQDGEEIITNSVGLVPTVPRSSGFWDGHGEYVVVCFFQTYAVWSIVESRFIAFGNLGSMTNVVRVIPVSDTRMIGVFNTTSNTVRVWDFNYVADPGVGDIPASPIHTFDLGGSSARQASVSNDNSMLAVTDNSDPANLHVFNTETWDAIPGTPIALGGLISAVSGRRLAWSHDDALLAVAQTESPYIVIYETSGWTTVSGPSTVHALTATNHVTLAFSGNGDYLAFALSLSTASTYVYNTSDWSVRFEFDEEEYRYVKFSADSQYLAAGIRRPLTAEGEGLDILNMSDGTLAFHLGQLDNEDPTVFRAQDEPIFIHPEGFLIKSDDHGTRAPLSLLLKYGTWEVVHPPPRPIENRESGGGSSEGAVYVGMTADGEGVIVSSDTTNNDGFSLVKGRIDWSPIAYIAKRTTRMHVLDDYLIGEALGEYTFYDSSTYQEVASPWDSSESPYQNTEFPQVSSQKKYFVQAGSDTKKRVIVRETETWSVVFDETFTDLAGEPFSVTFTLSDELNLLFIGFRRSSDTNGSDQKLYIYDTTTWTEIADQYPHMTSQKETQNSGVLTGTTGGISVYRNILYVWYEDDWESFIDAYDMDTWNLLHHIDAASLLSYNKYAISENGLLALRHNTLPIIEIYDAETFEFVTNIQPVITSIRDVWWIKGKNNEDLLVVTNNSQPGISISSVNAEEQQWWNGTAWQDTEVYIASSDEQVTLPLGAWLDE